MTWPGHGIAMTGHGQAMAFAMAWQWIGHEQAILGQKVDMDQKIRKIKVRRMEFSIVEHLSGPCGTIFCLVKGPQLNSGQRFERCVEFTDFHEKSRATLVASIYAV